MMGMHSKTSLVRRAAQLVSLLLALGVGAVAALPAMGQELAPEHLALARKYVDLTDKSGVYEATIVEVGINTYRQLLPQNPEIAPQLNKAIETVISSYKGRKGELFDQFARVYALAFTQEELTTIVAFYESPVGAKLSQANASLNGSLARVLNVFNINLQSEFFAQVRAELKAAGIDT